MKGHLEQLGFSGRFILYELTVTPFIRFKEDVVMENLIDGDCSNKGNLSWIGESDGWGK